MTAAARIEIGTGATAMPGLGKAHGAGSSLFATGSAASVFSSSAATAERDFRSGWQSLLMELGQPVYSAANATSGTSSSTIPTLKAAANAGSSSGTNAAQAASVALRQNLGLAAENEEAGSEKLTSTQAELPASAKNSIAVRALPEEKSKTESSKTDEKKTVTRATNDASGAAQGLNSPPPAQPAGLVAVVLQGTPPSSLQIDAAPATQSQSSPSSPEAIQPAIQQAVSSIPFTAGFSTASGPSSQLIRDGSSGSMEAAESRLPQRTGPASVAKQQAQISEASSLTASGQSGASEDVLPASGAQNAQKDASAAEVTLIEGDAPVDTARVVQILAQGTSLGQSSAEAVEAKSDNLPATSDPILWAKPDSLVVTNTNPASTFSLKQNVASEAAPVQSEATKANPDRPLAASPTAKPTASLGFEESKKPVPAASIETNPASTAVSSLRQLPPTDSGQIDLQDSANSLSAASNSAQNGLPGQQVATDSSQVSPIISDAKVVPAIQLSQRPASAQELRQNDSPTSGSTFSGRPLLADRALPAEPSALPSESATDVALQFNSVSMIPSGHNVMVETESRQIAALSVDSEQDPSHTAAVDPYPVRGFAIAQDQSGRSAHSAVPNPAVDSKLNSASTIPLQTEVTPASGAIQPAASPVHAEQSAPPVANENPNTSENSAVSKDRSGSQNTIAILNTAQETSATPATVQSVAVDRPSKESSTSGSSTEEPSPFQNQAIAAEPKLNRTAEPEQGSSQSAGQVPAVSQGVAPTAHLAEFTDQPSNSESAVEASQSRASTQTTRAGTIRAEARNPVSIKLPEDSESIAEPAANLTAQQLNPAQPLTEAPEPIQRVAAGTGVVSPASGEGANAVPPAPASKEASPAPADTSIPNSIAAAASTTTAGTGALQLPNAPQPAASSSEKTAVSSASRPALRASRLNAVQPGVLTATGGASSPLVDAAAGIRQQAELQGTSAYELASKPTAVESSAAETFAAIDAQGAPGRPAWIHTSAQQAEAGYEDPDLGWVGVRADASGSGIHAQLVAGSTDAAQALSGQMAGLNAFLTEHHTPVETLTLTTSGGGTGFSSGQETGSGMQQGTGNQAGEDAAQNARAETLSMTPSSGAPISEAALTKPVWQPGTDDSAMRAQWMGGHISVMA
jgi:hypothetical protein